MKKLIKSSRIYSHRGLVDGAIVVDGERVLKIMAKDAIPADFDGEVVDYGDSRIIPGIIDCHNHGFLGWDADTVDPNELTMFAKGLASVGVTGFLSTNGKWAHTLETNAMTYEYMKEKKPGARVFGLHMEGPFINPDRRGGFSDGGMNPPDFELCKAYYESSKGALKYMTLAPELEGNMEIIDYLVEKGVIVGVAHSNATYAQTVEAADHGLSIGIHTSNAMRPIHQREVSVLGGVLLDERIRCEVISDFYHVCPELITMIIKLKGKENVLLVSDSGSMSGAPAGKYMSSSGRPVYIEKSGLVHLEDGTISGSSKYVLFGIGNLVEKLGLPMEDVVIMSSLVPARVLGLEADRGSIKEGKYADFAVIDDNYDAIATYVEGSVEYDVNNKEELMNPEFKKNLVELF
ncbi:MAG: N-acetylglucosamine-6-phosphate deacetylase [Clostridiales bacterium]|nr:N-acetylglucosamine-6-phosphate deacetylase [Clostridiales bacterium]